MPTPFYDANDGDPAFLLINDGKGHFEDATEASGLGGKRRRRVYSASFVDVDEDGDLDLVTASDFAGIDIFTNDGRGRFRDVTETRIDESHCFGMSLTFGDYDLNGKFDIFMSGIGSTTARRLHDLGLNRDGFERYSEMRQLMGYGNRMYLNQGENFRQPDFKDQVARTGWAWGTSTFDFDNDGDGDLYIANGHVSGETVKDYCTRFWCHDIYTGTENENEKIALLFDQEFDAMESWNGFEHNALLMNESGRGFLNVAFLMGVAFEFDSRSVVSADFDQDGRVDLLVVEDNARTRDQIFHMLKNTWLEGGHWVTVQLRGRPRCSPLGAVVVVQSGATQYVKPIVAGDSYSSQHPTFAHFGLGDAEEVENIEVRWPNGTTSRMERPKTDQIHVMVPPE
ncbi:MAG: VCBS repeat-containing protein [Planctomycetes bacterium]|nr:VCBS repeat-containing protein [Planctomycetota bacterium]